MDMVCHIRSTLTPRLRSTGKQDYCHIKLFSNARDGHLFFSVPGGCNLVPRARARFRPAVATCLASMVLTKRNAASENEIEVDATTNPR